VIDSDPKLEVLRLNVATPEEFNIPVPSVVLPLRNVTVPEGIAPPEAAVTVAVNPTTPPTVTDEGEAVSAVVVFTFAAVTVTVTALDVDPLKLESPPYVAVIEFDPTVSVLTINVATPDAFSVADPSVVLPSTNVTVPVTPVPVTVAVSVTFAPALALVGEAVSVVVVLVFVGGGVTAPYWLISTVGPTISTFPSPSTSAAISGCAKFATASSIGCGGATVPSFAPLATLWNVPSPLPRKTPLSYGG
jgi:hypothetical protein